MKRYYFHLRDGVDVLIDPDGMRLPSDAAAAAHALKEARTIISSDAPSGRIDLSPRIDVEDERGTIIHSVPFERSVAIAGGPERLSQG